jgi:hypothetical protein
MISFSQSVNTFFELFFFFDKNVWQFLFSRLLND